MLVNLLLAGILFLPAIMVQMFQSTENQGINWLSFLFSSLGAQVATYCLVAVCAYIAAGLLPEKWLPSVINSTLSIPLVIIAIVCIFSVVLSSLLSEFNVLLIPNIISAVLCLAWATRAANNA